VWKGVQSNKTPDSGMTFGGRKGNLGRRRSMGVPDAWLRNSGGSGGPWYIRNKTKGMKKERAKGGHGYGKTPKW